MATEWVSLLSNVVLVLVTGWYAYLTLRISKTSQATAQSAEKSALAAERAAQASIAALDVSFDVGIYYIGHDGEDGEDLLDLRVLLTCAGATVYIHEASLVSAEIRSHSETGGFYRRPLINEEKPLHIFSYKGEQGERPYKEGLMLHNGEQALLCPSPRLFQKLWDNLGFVSVDVVYSLEEDGRRISRNCKWEEPHKVPAK